MSNLTNPADGAPGAADSYTAAILALLGERDPLPVLAATTGILSATVRVTPLEILRTPERPGKWSAVEVIQHLADSEIAWAWRLRSTLAQDRPELTGYDQDAWASRLRYADADPLEALQQFEVLRSGHLKMLGRLGGVDLQRVGVHRERGEESVSHMMRLYAGHDLVHLNQIERILSMVG